MLNYVSLCIFMILFGSPVAAFSVEYTSKHAHRQTDRVTTCLSSTSGGVPRNKCMSMFKILCTVYYHMLETSYQACSK